MKAGWAVKPLGALCEILDSQRKPITKRDRKPGANPYYGATGIQDFVEGYLFDEPLVLVGEDGAKWASGENTAFAIEGKCWVNNHAHVLRPNRTLLNDNWLIHFLVHSDLSPFVSGLTVPKLNQGNLREIPIPLPPLPEQRRIVALLDEAFAGIATAKANAEKNLQNARALFESHLQSVFTERGEGWVEKTVGELVEEDVLFKPFDGNHGEIHPCKADYVESGVPFIMACDLQNGIVDTERCKFIPRHLADSLRVGFAKDGDVLISHKGTIGRSAVVNTELDYIMLTPQVTSYRIKNANRLLNKFVRYYFMCPVFQHEMIAGAADGATRAYIGITKQLLLRFRFPSLIEQVRIVAKLDVLDPETQRLESLYQQKLAALDALKQSLLHQAFSGSL